jgi:hypothetical protein
MESGVFIGLISIFDPEIFPQPRGKWKSCLYKQKEEKKYYKRGLFVIVFCLISIFDSSVKNMVRLSKELLEKVER